MDEFSILCDADGIEKKDYLLVENEDGSESKVRYLGRVTEGATKFVKTLDEHGDYRIFYCNNLEEVANGGVIAGKWED